MESFFPKMVNDSITLERYTKLKERGLLILRYIQGNDVRDEIQRVEDEIFSMIDPQEYGGNKGLEVKHIKGFDNTCIVLQQYVPRDPKTMTTLEYFNALELLKKQVKEKNKKAKR